MFVCVCMCVTVCRCVIELFPEQPMYKRINAHFVWESKINIPMLAMAYNIKDHGHAPQDFLADITGMEKLISLAETTTFKAAQEAIVLHNSTVTNASKARKKKIPTNVTFKMLEMTMGKE